MSRIVFNEELHRYTLNGEVVPGVTTIMDPLYDFSHVPAGVLERAGRFGTAVHLMVKLHCQDDLDFDTLDDNLIGPYTAFNLWLKDYHYSVSDFIVEQPVGHDKLKYCGTPDLILDGLGIIDIKTRPCSKICDCIQIRAYEEAWKSEGGAKGKYWGRVLELRQDGTYDFPKAEDPQSWSMFRHLLDYHNAGKLIERWRKRK